MYEPRVRIGWGKSCCELVELELVELVLMLMLMLAVESTNDIAAAETVLSASDKEFAALAVLLLVWWLYLYCESLPTTTSLYVWPATAACLIIAILVVLRSRWCESQTVSSANVARWLGASAQHFACMVRYRSLLTCVGACRSFCVSVPTEGRQSRRRRCV